MVVMMNREEKKDSLVFPGVFDIVEKFEVVKAESGAIQTSPYSVTRREIEVLEKMSEGLTVKEIASLLYISTHTIVSHKKNLLEKFDARNSIELVVKAVRNNII